MVWESWRGIQNFAWPALVAVIILGLWHVTAVAQQGDGAGLIFGVLLGGLALATSLVFGLTAFVGDHSQRSFEFLGQRGVSSYQVAGARLVTSFGVAAALFAIASLFLIWSGLLPGLLTAFGVVLVAGQYLGGAVLELSRSHLMGWLLILWNAFGLAALASISFSRPVVGGVVALVLIPMAIVWTLIVAWALLPWWWASWPLGAVCWLAVWLRVRSRLSGRSRWVDCAIPWLAVLACWLILFGIAATYRASELPAVPVWVPAPGPDNEAAATSWGERLDELDRCIRTLNSMGAAWSGVAPDELPPQEIWQRQPDLWSERGTWNPLLRSTQGALEPVVRLVGDVHPTWLLQQIAAHRERRTVSTFYAMSLAELAFHQHLSVGQLNEAWLDLQTLWFLRRYESITLGEIGFSAAKQNFPWDELDRLLDHPEQTVDSLAALQHALEEEFALPPALISSESARTLWRAVLAVWRMNQRDAQREWSWDQVAWNWLPTERARAERWLNWAGTDFCARDLYCLRQLLSDESVTARRIQDFVNRYGSAFHSQRVGAFELAQLTTNPFYKHFYKHFVSSGDALTAMHAHWEMRELVAHQFAVLAKIALIKYRLEHGEYPPSLALLAPGTIHSDETLDRAGRELISFWPRGLVLTPAGADDPSANDGGPCILPMAFPRLVSRTRSQPYQDEARQPSGLEILSINPGGGGSAYVFRLPAAKR